MIEISAQQEAAIREHAERTFPEECCGIIIGKATATGAVADELLVAENTREDAARHNRFLIPPERILEATQRGRERGLDIVGYYHSHPNAPARPSDFDREHAWPATSYVIVSVREGASKEMTSWRLVADRSCFEEEGVTISPSD